MHAVEAARELEQLKEAVSPLFAANAAGQKDLIDGLVHALERSGRSVPQVAAILGVDESVVNEALAGETDLTLTETLYLAYAVDAHVRYEVTPSSALNSAKMPPAWSSRIWRETGKPGSSLAWPRVHA